MATPINTPARSNILGVGISILTPARAVDLFFAAARAAGHTGYVTVTGVHGVVESLDDPELKKIHNQSFISTPDGIPMVWASRWQGFHPIEQTCGPDFMPAVMKHSAPTGERHFLWGGGPGVVDTLKQKLESKYPGVQIVGTVSPPFRPLNEQEEEELVREIEDKRPHFFWVGLSTPKQERFMAHFLNKYRDRLTFADQGFTMFGVGAAFDFQAGLVKECPRWLRGSGLEWFYRMCKDPKRLARRYLRNNPRFIYHLLLQHTDLRSYPALK